MANASETTTAVRQRAHGSPESFIDAERPPSVPLVRRTWIAYRALIENVLPQGTRRHAIYSTLLRPLSKLAHRCLGMNMEPTGHIDALTWLPGGYLAMSGWFGLRSGELPRVCWMTSAGVQEITADVMAFRRDECPIHDPAAGKLVVMRIPGATGVRPPAGTLKLQCDTFAATLRPFELARRTFIPEEWIGRVATGQDDTTPGRQLHFLATATSPSPSESCVRWSRTLCALHRLRGISPAPTDISPQLPQGLKVEGLCAVDSRSYFVIGWARDITSPIVRLTAVSSEGVRAELRDVLCSIRREDVAEYFGLPAGQQISEPLGFAAFFQLEAPSIAEDGWRFEMENAAGVQHWSVAPSVVTDAATIRATALGMLGMAADHSEVLEAVAHPTISIMQRRAESEGAVVSVSTYGSPPSSPRVSIIVPLYKRIDFVEQQLAQFANDPEIVKNELLYVLDSPELAQQLEHLAPALHEIYEVPFRLITLARNVGFARANNIGAEHARGRLLLLLNSDVLPDAPGWLGKMARFYESSPRVGAVGAKLLYEDESLQHAGMYFRRGGDGTWENGHYYKGLSRNFPPANILRRVPAVTGACTMISRILYNTLGGLRGGYVAGDFEDSDLCLRLLEADREVWYLPEVELYHLEGQSYPEPARQLTYRYNSWLHTKLWSEQIAALMKSHAQGNPMSPGESSGGRIGR